MGLSAVARRFAMGRRAPIRCFCNTPLRPDHVSSEKKTTHPPPRPEEDSAANVARRFAMGRRAQIRGFCNTPLQPDHVSSEKRDSPPLLQTTPTPPPPQKKKDSAPVLKTTPPVKNIFGRFSRFIQSKRDDVFNQLQEIDNGINSLKEQEQRVMEETCQLLNDISALEIECADKLAKFEKDLELEMEEKLKIGKPIVMVREDGILKQFYNDLKKESEEEMMKMEKEKKENMKMEKMEIEKY